MARMIEAEKERAHPRSEEELRSLYLDATEEDIPMDAFREAEEIFLTSTGRDVQPVHDVDGRAYPTGGPLTAAAAEAFRAVAADSDDP